MNIMCYLIVIIILIIWSLWARVALYRINSNNLEQINIKPSPLSQAVQDLIATAGGVYLSIIMLVSFLRIDTPERINFFMVSVDPIALLALTLAVIQPILIKLYKG